MLATKEQVQEMEKNQEVLKNTRFTINAETMKGIKQVIKGHKNGSLPILNSIVIEVVNNTLINVKYTDSDLFIEKMFFAKVEQVNKKMFCIPISFIKDIKYIKKNETFVLEEVENNVLKFTRNNMSQNIQLFDESEYIDFSFLEEDDFKQVETSNGYEYFENGDLNVFEKAIKSVSKSEGRPVLCEVNVKDGYVTSTDSHRLYKAKTIFKLDESFVINPVLIKKAKELTNKDMFLKMSVNQYRIKIQDDYSTRIYYNHLEGNFPDTSRIIPTEFNYVLEIDKVDELYNFVKSFKEAHVDFKLNVNTGMSHFEVVTENSKSVIDIPARFIKNLESEFKMTFSSLYLKEALEQLDKEEFRMNIVGNLKPFILEKQNSDKEFTLLLPVRRK